LKSSNEIRERREDAIAMVVPPRANAVTPAIASPRATRFVSLIALAALAWTVLVVGRGAYFAITDAWVAPLHLSPDSREVVALRVQATREKEERGRLESELTSAAAEIETIDLSQTRLRTLADGYANAIRWSTNNSDGQLAALTAQKALLETQRAMAVESIERDKSALDRAKRNVDAGAMTTTDLEATQTNLARTQLTRSEKELEYVRVSAALEEAARQGTALAGAATHPPSAGTRGARLASPDVVRLDEVRINVELQIARLESEKRAAESRQRAARASLNGMTQLRTELETTPFFLAAEREIDLAFVPYAHLEGVRPGDVVYSCRWFLIGCRETGLITRIFPGEVVTNDPWGSVARGQYAELELSDRSAVAERTLRVRRAGAGDGHAAGRLAP
jgi:hypothetical protein